jgi:excisionase family DNA binding protein
MISSTFLAHQGVLRLKLSASLDDWLTTDDVATLFNVTPLAVTRMISKGRLKAEKKGWIHLVHKSDLPDNWPPPIA